MKENKETKKNLSRRDFVKTTAVGLGATALTGVGAAPSDAAQGAPAVPQHWDQEADVVVIGAGATGLPAAIEAVENGASVIMVEANPDIGGAASLSNGNVSLGGGTTRQKKYGIEDSADMIFKDLTDWTVLERNGYPDYRYNDREIIRAFADMSAPTCEWLAAHGVVYIDIPIDNIDEYAVGNSAMREHHAAAMNYVRLQTGKPLPPDVGPVTSSGIGFTKPLEASARKLGVKILLETRMTKIVREAPLSGRVLGIIATNNGKTVNIRAKKGVIIGTGGHQSNVNFRRIFDPRLTEEYEQTGGPWVISDASGELAAMALGASLWGTYNQTAEFGVIINKGGSIGSRGVPCSRAPAPQDYL
jgi:succinate dehydrogenase/fumarate reductase flavoprotein subunit